MNKKRIALVLMFVLIFNVFIVSSNASTATGVTPRWNNCSSVDAAFVVASGTAEASFTYLAYSSMSSADFKVEIQKQAFWFIWNTLETWTTTTTAKDGYHIITTPADGNGNYRAKFTLTFYGTDGTSDVVEDTIEFQYNA